MRKLEKQDYLFKTKPFKHQLDVFLESRDKEAYALFHEQGTGKSKVVIDTAGWLYANGKIDCVIIVAPNGVHRNWQSIEIPTHLPDHIPHVSRIWNSNKAKNKSFKKELDDLFLDGQILRFFMLNIDAINVKASHELVERLLTCYHCLMVVDESHLIKNWNIKRSKALVKLGKQARYRRILTGTPMTQGPSDIYGQFLFLGEDLLGFTSFYTFQNRYTKMVTDVSDEILQKMPPHERREIYLLRGIRNKGGNSRFVKLESKNPDGSTRYQNLEELKQKIAPYSSRITKDECLDLPEKLYSKRFVELSKEQKELYAQLKDELIVEIDNNELTAPLVITRMLRLQQILGGFLPFDDGTSKKLDCPRFAEFLDLLRAVEGKIIVWSRFTNEIEELCRLAKHEFGDESTVRYYGAVCDDERQENINRFQNDPFCRFFIGNQKAGGTGLTLHAANNMLYYSNDFSLATRLQSEDRAHRIGQKNNVTYFDMIAENTMDETIVSALIKKQDIASQVTGDKIKKWL